MPEQTINKGGRPRIEIDENNFKKLCAIQCTLEEIASFFDCSVDTVERWCERTFGMGFAESYKKYSQNGKISLRRWQIQAAKKGNVSMLIWLGRQWLGQKDNVFEDDNTEAACKEMANALIKACKSGVADDTTNRKAEDSNK